jgi:hypothetical protein
MYNSVYEAITAQRLSSPIDEQMRRTIRPARRIAMGTRFRPVTDRGESL